MKFLINFMFPVSPKIKQSQCKSEIRNKSPNPSKKIIFCLFWKFHPLKGLDLKITVHSIKRINIFKLFPLKYRKYVFAYYMEIIFSFPRLNDLMLKTPLNQTFWFITCITFYSKFKKLTWDQYICSHWVYFKGSVESFVTKWVLLWQVCVFCWKSWQHLT